MTVLGRDRAKVIEARFLAGRRLIKRDAKAPFAATIKRRALRRAKGRLSVDVVLGDGRRATKARKLRRL